MRVHPVELDLSLSDDRLVDIMLIQWRTPMEHEEGIGAPVLEKAAALKERVLESLVGWTLREHSETARPLFVLSPEVSTSLAALETFKRLLDSVKRPAVVVAGMEYLSRDGYRELISKSKNPEPESWIEGLDAAEKVNAAVIMIRDANGNFGFYVQPKIHPADLERRWRVYGASHALVFHHENHAPGAGIHFCVQICSDFCSESRVSLLRKKILEGFGNEDLRLDLTLLLECNTRQDMPQFRDGTNAYFVPRPGEVRTEAGTLVMLNNASRTSGKSAGWGDSQFRFRYKQWQQGGGEFTYSLAQQTGEGWQAATFREPGPSIYWLTYKPLYLCDSRPGSGDSLPFKEACCWKISNSDNLVPTFKHISAVMHWLEAEWGSGTVLLTQSLAEPGINKEIADRLLRTYSESAAEWIAALNNDLAKDVLRTLFVCFRRKGYPYGTTDYPETEPRQWGVNSETAKAAIKMVRLHALLSIGASESGNAFTVAPLRARHVLLANSISTTYLWGGGETGAEKMVEDYRNDLSREDLTSTQYSLIVLMTPRNRPDLAQLEKRVSENRINTASAPSGAGAHLKQQGEVTRGETWKLIFAYGDSIEDAVAESDLIIFRSRLSEVVQGAVNRATAA